MIDDTDIMACGHIVAPEVEREIEQNPELDELVASDAWGGRSRMGVIIPGRSEDDLRKDVADFADMVFDAQIFGILCCINDIVIPCADFCIFGIMLQLHRDPDDFMAGVAKQKRGQRAVNAAAHGNCDF